MTFDEYQEAALQTAIYPGSGTPIGLCYSLANLAGEAGEAISIFAKAIRDDSFLVSNDLSEEKVLLLKKELGDCLWMIAAVCNDINSSVEEVADINLTKLADRKNRMTLRGSGDDR